MGALEIISAVLPLLNFVLIWVLKPTFDNLKTLQKTISTLEEEIRELKKMNEFLEEEVRLLKELVFRSIPAEQLQDHLLCQLQDKPKKGR